MVEFPANVLAQLALDYLDGGYRLGFGSQPVPPGYVMAVYGRYSVCLAQRMAEVLDHEPPQLLVVSGNVGKDSGRLVQFGIPEAHYLVSAADGLTGGTLFASTPMAIDLTALDGAQNAARMVELLMQSHLGTDDVPVTVLVLAHRTQMRRLGLTFNAAAERAGLRTDQIIWIPSSYDPDLNDPYDQWEILLEYTLLDDRSKEGVFPRPDGLRSDLLREARRVRDELAAQLSPDGTPLSTAGRS